MKHCGSISGFILVLQILLMCINIVNSATFVADWCNTLSLTEPKYDTLSCPNSNIKRWIDGSKRVFVCDNMYQSTCTRSGNEEARVAELCAILEKQIQDAAVCKYLINQCKLKPKDKFCIELKKEITKECQKKSKDKFCSLFQAQGLLEPNKARLISFDWRALQP